jgi:hypothetical protein
MDTVWEPQMEDLDDGTGTEPLHMTMMLKTLARQNGNQAEIELVSHKVRSCQMATKQLKECSSNLASKMFAANAQITGDLYDLRNSTESLERKLALLEMQLLDKSDMAGGEPIASLAEIRVLARKAAGMGSQQGGGKPMKKDLARTTMLGKIRLLRGSTFADVRRLIAEEFDDEGMPDKYKFYTIGDEPELVGIHVKQEERIPIDSAVVYMVPVGEREVSRTPRTPTLSNYPN